MIYGTIFPVGMVMDMESNVLLYNYTVGYEVPGNVTLCLGVGFDRETRSRVEKK